MATPNSFILLITFLLYSSSILLISFIWKSEALENRHSLKLDSDSSTSHCKRPYSTGSMNRESTFEVSHRNSPCSSSTTQNHQHTLADILRQDQLRLDRINSRLKSHSHTNKFKDTKANLPARSGQLLGSGNYIVNITFGTHGIMQSLVFDTSSDLTWTRGSSSSYSLIDCESSECLEFIIRRTPAPPDCSTSSQCEYTIKYGDGRFSTGILGKANLTITQTEVIPEFIFGIDQNNQQMFGDIDGILGMNRGEESLVTQTAEQYGKSFLYCLPSNTSTTGYLTLGNGSSPDNNLTFTPLITDPDFYKIEITYITIGGTRLSIDQSIFQDTGTIIDSGTVLTYLPTDAYNTMRDEFRKQMGDYPTAPAFSLMDTCYDTSYSTTITVPTISFTFGGNATVELSSHGILVVVNSSLACFAFADNSAIDGEMSIFGNTQQKTMEVVYDVAGERLGFRPGACE